jgi:hypothetical protein
VRASFAPRLSRASFKKDVICKELKMRNVTCVFALTLLLLIPVSVWSASSGSDSSSARCQNNTTNKKCKNGVLRKSKPKKIPSGGTPEIKPSTGPFLTRSTLTQKQSQIRDAYAECIRHSSAEEPIANVLNYVFEAQMAREDASIKSFFLALRGSTVHHGHEVCLVRAFGLKGFRTVLEAREDVGAMLVNISSPYIEVVESEIPFDRRFARTWVRDYVVGIAQDMNEHFQKEGTHIISFSPLRITSMLRTYEEQEETVRRGLSPADCRYVFLCSSHTSGSGIDIGLRRISIAQNTWLEKRLLEDQRSRKIFFIRERSHYHVLVIPPEYIGEE